MIIEVTSNSKSDYHAVHSYFTPFLKYTPERVEISLIYIQRILCAPEDYAKIKEECGQTLLAHACHVHHNWDARWRLGRPIHKTDYILFAVYRMRDADTALHACNWLHCDHLKSIMCLWPGRFWTTSDIDWLRTEADPPKFESCFRWLDWKQMTMI